VSKLSLIIRPTSTATSDQLDALAELVDEDVAFHLGAHGTPVDASFSSTLSVPASSRSGSPYIAVHIRGDWDFAPLGKLGEVIADDLLSELRHAASEVVIRISATRVDSHDGTMQSTLYQRTPQGRVVSSVGPTVETGIL